MHWGYDIVCDNALRLPSNNQCTDRCAMCNVQRSKARHSFWGGATPPLTPLPPVPRLIHLRHAIVVLGFRYWALGSQHKQHMPIMAVALGPLDNLITVLDLYTESHMYYDVVVSVFVLRPGQAEQGRAGIPNGNFPCGFHRWTRHSLCGIQK